MTTKLDKFGIPIALHLDKFRIRDVVKCSLEAWKNYPLPGLNGFIGPEFVIGTIVGFNPYHQFPISVQVSPKDIWHFPNEFDMTFATNEDKLLFMLENGTDIEYE